MKSWLACVTVVLSGVLLVHPSRADHGPLFAPPPPSPAVRPLPAPVRGVVVALQDWAERAVAEDIEHTLPADIPPDPGYSSAEEQAPAALPGAPEPLPRAPAAPPAVSGCYAACGDCSPACDPCACGPTCALSACSGCGRCCDPCVPWRLPQPCLLEECGIRIGGWVDQGVSAVANNPLDNYCGVVTFNDRHAEYQMNQLWMYVNRDVDTGGCGWDWGGRIDFLYGTDARFTQAVDGLEANWDQRERFYRAALPQFYLDIGYNDWTLRTGHFFTILGYEAVQAPDNFFYSHAYAKQYGVPFTHAGMVLTRAFTERLRLSAGLHRGNDQFDDTDGLNDLGFLGGVEWTSCDGRLSAAFAISAGEQGQDVSQTIYSVVGTWRATCRLRYAIEHVYGHTSSQNLDVVDGEWYGINQYLVYKLNDCWSAGVRFEWFRDNDGTRVTGLGDGNLCQGPFVGNFYALSAGVNWSPHANVVLRPEIRWDWFDATVVGQNVPFDAGEDDDQFMFGCDLIVTF